MMYKCTGYFLWTNSNPSKLKNDACVGKIVFTVIDIIDSIICLYISSGQIQSIEKKLLMENMVNIGQKLVYYYQTK